MNWQRRIFELVCAGGSLVMLSGGYCANGASDPCAGVDTPQCTAEEACRQEGGTWELETARVLDAGSGSGLMGHCAIPCAGPAFNCGADAAFNDASHHTLPDAPTDAPRDATIGGD